jgi:hypothetical protein
MKKQTGVPIKAHIIRGASYILLFLAGTVMAFFSPETPTKISRRKGLGVIVKALAPGVNTMPSTVVLVETVTLVILERSKVAVSADPLGTMRDVQFSGGVPITADRIGAPAGAVGVDGREAKQQCQEENREEQERFHRRSSTSPGGVK